MDERTLRVLEFSKIRDRLRQLVETAVGAELGVELGPATDFREVQERLGETAEARLLLREGELPLRGVHDLRPHLARTRIGGALAPDDLLQVLQTARTARKVKGAVLSRAERVPLLAALVRDLPTFELLEAELERAIGEDGAVLDSASPELAYIRRQLRATEQELRAKLEELLRSPRWSRMLQDPIVTVRGERYVVPVKQQYAHQFPGILHDQSSSGATAFMEPLVAVQLGNRIRALRGAEEREIQRVLNRLSERVAARAAELEQAVRILARLDLAFAKARLADELDAVLPELVPHPQLELVQARHPLLVYAQRADPQRPVVPVDVRLGMESRTLILTGPNTGGKTVTLKTIGLLQLMLQSGLFVPASPRSRMGVFPQVFADIGDEQSIEQSLSTFSSHLQAIVEILRNARPGSLVLLDEIGAGTDPAEGSALARAILETLHERQCRVVATTHYGELKAMAYERAGVENASVEFDVETLRPTYRLRLGIPGSSHAFVIAQRLGLDAAVLERARSYLRRGMAEMEAVLAGLSADQRRMEAAREEAERLRKEAEEERRRYEALRAELQAERERLLRRAREDARALVERAREEVERLLAELRARRTVRDAEQARTQLAELVKALQEARAEELGEPLETVAPGDRVRVASLRAEGTVVGVTERDEVEVQVGRWKVRVPRSNLRAATGGVPSPRPRVPSMDSPAAQAPTRLDLRGMSVDDAVYELERALDAALLAGLPRLVVVHGKGTGALRRAVREALAAHPEVRFRSAPPHEGGEGATIVELSP
ncbi:MAG: endonuclease MutS2 [Armatimonadota bacterium]|nr:endonuclease MutS2 [Armatimonadota bacterium]MDR7439581.1 endonuclease MutS2 [Armatimonadota bacterium]MDR7562740.1 endonuclease MutS2 [Armatimonadota bacterium]MDR7568624.1 endonuclease MutS2 [Armatimonadota bacterium]MDR7601039.1 endonuclease MutS2 [Armatimonadota bacterium]